MRPRWVTTIALAVLTVAALVACCTAMRRDRAPDTMRLLTQAGFKTLPADTPAKVAKLSTLTPYTVMPWTRKSGATVYAYAAPDLCKCVYVGSPKQYAKFKELLSAEESAEIAAQERAEFEPQEFSEYTLEEGGA